MTGPWTAAPAQTSFADQLFGDLPSLSAPHRPPNLLQEVSDASPTPIPLAGGLPELIPVFRVKLVQTDFVPLRERPIVRSPSSVVALLERHLMGADREHFVCVLLTTKNQVIGVVTVSVGDLSAALVHPREVFKAAILANAAAILVAHNHPSGDPTPSPEDVAVTRRLREAGETLGIEVLDHVVLAGRGRFISLREIGSW